MTYFSAEAGMGQEGDMRLRPTTTFNSNTRLLSRDIRYYHYFFFYITETRMRFSHAVPVQSVSSKLSSEITTGVTKSRNSGRHLNYR